MATRREAMEALKRADEAGNTEDARRLAQILQSRSDDGMGAMDIAGGVGETALTFGTGAVAAPAAGIAGLAQGAYDLVRGADDPLGSAAERVESTQESMTYQPRTQAGRTITQGAAVPFEQLGQAARSAGGQTLERTGSPAAATAVQTGIESLPDLVGVRGTRGARRQRQEDIAGVEQQAEDVGFDLGGTAERQRQQVVEAGETATGGRTTRGEPMPQIQAAINDARQASKENVDRLYEAARSEQAGIPISQAREFTPQAEQALRSFDVETMPIVQRRLGELRELNNLPDDSAVKLSALDNWRKRLNKNRPASTDRSQSAALDVLKGQFDNFLETQFNADMIKGSPLAIAKWKEAREAFSDYKKTFDENRTIAQMARRDVTPEEMRQWIFGASTVGAKKQAGDTVRRVKEIVGEDSPQMAALRQDALLDVMEPLMRETPNLKGFVSNYDRFVRNNPSLVKELFPESQGRLKSLRQFASAAQKRAPDPVLVDLNRIAATTLFGHGIAQAGLKVRLARNAFNMLRRAGDKSTRKQIMGDVLGYDPFAPLLPKTPAVVGGVTQAGIQASENGAQDQQSRPAGGQARRGNRQQGGQPNTR